MTSSRPQKRNLNWSMKVWTTSSKCGLMFSNLSKSPNSYCSRVGHQHIARFLLSMQLILLLSDTLKKEFILIHIKVQNVSHFSIFVTLKGHNFTYWILYLTKCWKRNLSTAWLALGSRSKSFFISSNLMCLSGITAICSRSVMCSCK